MIDLSLNFNLASAFVGGAALCVVMVVLTALFSDKAK